LYRLAILGLGGWGRRLVDAVQGRSEQVGFAAAVVTDPAKHEAYAALRGLALGRDYRAVLADPAIDGIVIATPHSRHAEHAVAAAEAGKPVFVEKPLALTLADARRIAAACDAAPVPLAVGHNRRFLPAFQALSDELTAGAIGALLHIEGHFSAPSGHGYGPGSWRAAPGESPAGGLAGLGIHLVDAMIALAGPIRRVWAHSRRRVLAGIDDTTTVVLELESGVMATLVSSTASPVLWSLRLSGSAGRLELADERHLIHAGFSGPVCTLAFAPIDTERLELEAFADAIAGQGAYPVTVEQTTHGIAVFEAIVRASQAGPMTRVEVEN
jgi:predicted dehydrogenase